ncbi:hypothetical protein ACEQ8H_004756 [Pleosporales sp. CAS-2024a]
MRARPRGCWLVVPGTRAYARSPTAPPFDRVDVPCRSSGRITVDVFAASAPASPVIVYLPPGPLVPDRKAEEQRVIAALRDTAAATVARINYRASPEHGYPTPVHDVLFGWDWIRDNLLLDGLDRPYLARLGVCGELLGGSLATMLALTECRLGESRIAAAAVNNPIVDWVFPHDFPVVDAAELPEPMAPDETSFPAEHDTMELHPMLADKKPAPKPRRRTRKTEPLPAWQQFGHNKTLPSSTLSAQRHVLFGKPQDYLDRFASPIHFFRSPHAQLLLPHYDNIFASQEPEDMLDMEAQMALEHYNSVHAPTPSPPEVPVLSRCRSYARNYPVAGARLSLPEWTITAGMESPLLDQSAELVKVLRRSMARHAVKTRTGRTRWHDAVEKDMYDDYASARVTLRQPPGIGLWTDQSDDSWTMDVQQVATWMKERLDVKNA